jgi:hypothetical protein
MSRRFGRTVIPISRERKLKDFGWQWRPRYAPAPPSNWRRWATWWAPADDVLAPPGSTGTGEFAINTMLGPAIDKTRSPFDIRLEAGDGDFGNSEAVLV